MSPAQPRLFPDAQPLVERLGREFFLSLPPRPGVYFLQDRSEAVLYVGKARNLRQRLGSYRVANPERMPRRILRLVHRVEAIRWEECATEMAALVREAELLLALRPPFNRAGVWMPPLKVVAWRPTAFGVDLAVQSSLEEGWRSLGAFRSRARARMQALARLAWCRMQPERGWLGLPCGWWRGRQGDQLSVPGEVKVFLQLLEEVAEGRNVQAGASASVLEELALAEDFERVEGLEVGSIVGFSTASRVMQVGS
jgi:hypothetical protein